MRQVKGRLEPTASRRAGAMNVVLGRMEITIQATLTPLFQLTPLPILQSAGDVFLEQIKMPMKDQVCPSSQTCTLTTAPLIHPSINRPCFTMHLTE